MSINNRKYIQSTGSLLARLNEESNSNQNNIYLNNGAIQNKQIQKQVTSFNNQQNNTYNRGQANQYQQQQNGTFTNMQQYSTAQVTHQHSMFGSGFNQNPIYGQSQQLPQQTVAAASQLFNQLNNQDIIMMQNTKMSQQHQQRNNRQSKNNNQNKQSNYNSNRDLKKKNTSHSSSHSKKPSSSSTTTELPETFGLPSNNKKNINFQQSERKSQNQEILIGDIQQNQALSSSEEIEIISENYPENSTSNYISGGSNDDLFKSYLGRNFRGQLAVVPKPQCNFVSNFTCIKQILEDSNYYENRRCKPYSGIKLRSIYNENSNTETEDEENDTDYVNQNKNGKKLKTTHIIVIDDTNEELHKPWITPELIKLIKHRNLLQAKLAENTNQESASNLGPDEELLKKFKNLRNKVTKLVKKSRKDYLTKYIAEQKEIKKNNDNSQVIDTTEVSSLAQDIPPTTSQNIASAEILNKPNEPSKTNNEQIDSQNFASISNITEKLKSDDKSTFLKSQEKLMMGLYNQYYAQYMQQYQQQQQEAHELAQMAIELDKKKEDPETKECEIDQTQSNILLLKKQAAYYAKQQASIQSQLEASLSQSAQQLIEEISIQAAKQIQKPLIFNQFSQQQHHLHQHIHHNAPNMATFQVQQPYQGQSLNAVSNFEPKQQIPQQQQGYNMHYNYNMVVS